MPKLELNIKPTMEPKLELTLRQKLALYKTAHAKFKAAEAEVEKLKAELGAIRDEECVEKLELEGVGSIVLRCDTYEAFDEMKFIANGGDLDVYKQSLVRKPKKAYELITLAKDKG